MNPYDPNAEQPQLPKQALLQMLAGGGDPTQSSMQQAGNAGMFEPAIGAIANVAPQIASAAQGYDPNANNPYAGMDPALAAIYQKAGQQPGGRGTGFADWQYWQGVGPSQYGRLASDIAGTGPDQTTGTPWGEGAWQGSGQGGSGGGSQMPTTLTLSGLNPILQGNATSNINSALQNIGAMTKGNSYLQSLIDALGGGGMQ